MHCTCSTNTRTVYTCMCPYLSADEGRPDVQGWRHTFYGCRYPVPVNTHQVLDAVQKCVVVKLLGRKHCLNAHVCMRACTSGINVHVHVRFTCTCKCKCTCTCTCTTDSQIQLQLMYMHMHMHRMYSAS